MKHGKKAALIAVGLVAGLALGSVGIGYAATDTAVPETQTCGVRMGPLVKEAGGRLVDIAAELTGLSVDDIKAKRTEGESMAAIVEAEGVSVNDVLAEAIAVRKALLDAKVADGTIDQATADAIIERMTERVYSTETGPPAWGGGKGGGRGGMGGPGGCGGTCSVPSP